MVKKKHKLDAQENTDLRILGISSVESELRLCWAFNQNLATTFKLDSPLTVQLQENYINFSRYTCIDEDDLWKFSLVKNKNSVDVLFPEIKSVDYIFFVQGDFSDLAFEELFNNIKTILEVSAVLRVNASNLKALKKISL